MGMLVYYCATGYLSLKMIRTTSILNKAGENDMAYLEEATGDYYCYQSKSKEWVPAGNTGLHYSRTIKETRHVKKSYVYHPKCMIDPTLYFNCPQEQIITLKKIFCSHWLLKDLVFEFKAFAKNAWDPHPTNISDTNIMFVHSNYKVLAEGQRGPQIAEHEKSICTQFEITPMYPETIFLLRNFLNKYLISLYVIFIQS